MRHLWSLQVSRIPCYTDLYPGSNVYLTKWFILSVLFLTGSGISVVPTCVCNNPSHGGPPWSELLPYQLVHFVCVVFDRRLDCCGPYMCLRSPGTQTFTNVGMSTGQLIHSVCIVFDRWWDVYCGYMCLGSPVTRTSTQVEISTRPAGSFCLCWFLLQAVRSLWFQHVSKIPLHTDLHPGRNIYSTSHFILSVLFFDREWDICDPYRCPGSPVTQTSTLVATSTQPAGSFCLCCFWQAVTHLWSLHVCGIPRHTHFHPSRTVCLTSWIILSVFFLTGNETSVVLTHGWDPPSHEPSPQ